MAGKVISTANAAHIQSMHDTTTRLGAQCGSAAKRLALKAADQGVFDLIDAVRMAMYRAVSHAEAQDHTTYPHLEDIYPDRGYAIIEIGERYWRANYTQDASGVVALASRDAWQEVIEVWQEVSAGTKAGALVADEAAPVLASVKALGDRTLELRIAWGRDAHGESFTPRTDFDLENFPTPPILYYHGYKSDGKPAPRPVVIGKTIQRENRADGHYVTVKLNSKTEATTTYEAAAAGRGVVSPGTAAHLIRKDASGNLLYWPLVEVSAWDGTPTRKQAHPGSLAFVKAAYAEAGIPIPAILSPTEASDEGEDESTTDIDPTVAGRVIAAEVAKALLSLRTEEPAS